MDGPQRHQRDWVSSPRSRIVAWGIPTTALILGIFVTLPWKTFIWVLALLWMGVACVLNARRCGRRHCFLTGPFFMLMGIGVALHGSGILPLGPQGWWWLGAVIVVGGYGVLWILPERIWGEYVTEPTEREDV